MVDKGRATLIQRQTERLGERQGNTGEEKVLWLPSIGLPVPKGPTRDLERDFFARHVVIGQWGAGLTKKE